MIINSKKAIEFLKNEEIVAIPTETVYGLGGLATSQKAVSKIFEAKNRPSDNPLICHFSSFNQIKKYVPSLNKYTEVLIKKLTPGPLSILVKLPKNSQLKASTRGQDSVICRIPNHPATLKIIKKVDIPIAAPSANTSGRVSGTNAKMVEEDLGSKIAGTVDGGECQVGLESTILDCRDENKITILRPGAIGKKEIKKVLEKEGLKIEIFEEPQTQTQTTPGSKYPHYAPNKPVHRVDDFLDIPWKENNFAVLGTDEKILEIERLCEFSTCKCHAGMRKDPSKNNWYFPTLNENVFLIKIGTEDCPEEIAQNLYKNLVKTNSLKINKIYFVDQDFGQSSVGKALRNRLKKIFQK